MRLHIAKTGTSVTTDRNATVDTWVAGGVQFHNGEKYSYVVVVGTGDASQPFGRSLHASQVAAPLVRILLEDLERDIPDVPLNRVANATPITVRTPPPPPTARKAVAQVIRRRPKFSVQDLIAKHLFNGG